MSLSSYLAIDALSESQSGKDVTINSIRDALDARSGYASKSIAGTGVVTLTNAESRIGVLELTGLLTGNRTVELPTAMAHNITILNNTTGAFTVDVRYGSGTTVRLPRGSSTPIRKSGTAAAYGTQGMTRLPEIIAYRASNQSLTPATDVVVAFDTETSDPSESFASNVFTAPAAGLYEFHAEVEIEVTVAGTGNSNTTCALRKNGTIASRGNLIQGPAAALALQRVSVHAMLSLAQGDTVDIVARQDQTGSTSQIVGGSDRTYLWGRAIRLG